MSQQSSSAKKEKDAMEDKKRNPILKYIGKPKISSQSSEYRHLLGHRFTTALLPEETCSHPPALGSPWPAAGTSQQLPRRSPPPAARWDPVIWTVRAPTWL